MKDNDLYYVVIVIVAIIGFILGVMLGSSASESALAKCMNSGGNAELCVKIAVSDE